MRDEGSVMEAELTFKIMLLKSEIVDEGLVMEAELSYEGMSLE